MLVSSTRMYNVNPDFTNRWHRLLNFVFTTLGISVTFHETYWPTPIQDFWARKDTCCTFMCSRPLAEALQVGRGLHLIASPIPRDSAFQGRPRYRSEFIVSTQSHYYDLSDTEGTRYGWMEKTSHSGWYAPNKTIQDYADRHRRPLYSTVLGPLGNPHNSLSAIERHAIDVTAIDGWYMTCLRLAAPVYAKSFRTIAYTTWAPIPPLVCGEEVSDKLALDLRSFFVALEHNPTGRTLLDDLGISRFCIPAPQDYLGLLSLQADQPHLYWAVAERPSSIT